MKALTFLEFIEKTLQDGHCSDYWKSLYIENMFTKEEIEFYTKQGIFVLSEHERENEYYYFDLFKALEFWNRKPTIELIKELFKFEKIEDSYKTLYITNSDETELNMTILEDYEIIFEDDYKVPYPHTLDMFISNCRQCEIDLEFKNEER